jgi:hypothetical protein
MRERHLIVGAWQTALTFLRAPLAFFSFVSMAFLAFALLAILAFAFFERQGEEQSK